jgi:EAL domain-containing protein (putative c-di-GMP-specific phosphodiesterase class I)
LAAGRGELGSGTRGKLGEERFGTSGGTVGGVWGYAGLVDSPPGPKPTTSNVFHETPFSQGGVRPGDSIISLSQFVTAEDLSVVFQPIVDMHTLEIFAYEALTRCKKPEFKNPMKLFERAAAEGCCGRLGRMVRDIAVPLCAGFHVFLNAHPEELQQPWLVRTDDPMFAHEHQVFLEVTEAVPFTHFELCKQVLRDLRARANIRVVVDDLGAGYSNLKYIADLAPDVVKLDRDLIMGVVPGSRQHRLVRAIVRLCVDLDARVVAEGIETEAEFLALRDTGVHFGQGYFMARPGFPLPTVTPEALKLRTAVPARDGSRPSVTTPVAAKAK